jgi:hypothetical protein
MYVDTAKTVRHGKTYYRHLLRDSFRENGKVKHHTIANLSKCSEEEIKAIKLALKYKGHLTKIGSIHSVEIAQGMRIGAVCLLQSIAERMSLIKALGNGQQARLALWQIFVRLIGRRSRFSATILAENHSACNLLGLKTFNEEKLHENLIWLSEKQESIERYLLADRFEKGPSHLFLFDHTVTCCLKDRKTELKDFECNNSNKKEDIHQIVLLLTDPEGLPVAVRSYEKTTHDIITEQTNLLSETFGVGRIVHLKNQMPEQITKDLFNGFIKLPAIKEYLISVMLSYLLERKIEKYWHAIDVSFDEGINEVGLIQTVKMAIANRTYHKVPTPTGLCKKLLDAAGVKLPLIIPERSI